MKDPRPSPKNSQAPLPWMPMWTTDILGSSAWQMASWEERGLLFHLMCLSWEGDGLPDDPDRIAQAGGDREAFSRCWTYLQEVFPVAEDGRRRHPKLEHWRSLQESRREAGRKGAHARWHGKAHGKPNGKSHGTLHGKTMPPETRDQRPEKRDQNQRPDPPARREPDGDHHQVVRYWEALWEETRGCEWVWAKKHFAAIKAVRRLAADDLQEVLRRIDNLLGSQDPWLFENADPTLLRSRWNQLALSEGQKPSRNGPQKGAWLKDLELE